MSGKFLSFDHGKKKVTSTDKAFKEFKRAINKKLKTEGGTQIIDLDLENLDLEGGTQIIDLDLEGGTQIIDLDLEGGHPIDIEGNAHTTNVPSLFTLF